MNNPYNAPGTPPTLQGADAEEPKSIKVFGVLHIIFGILGLLMTVLGAVCLACLGPFLSFLENTMAESGPVPEDSPDPSEIIRLFGELFSSQMPYYIISSVVTAILSTLLLTAGISLVKKLRRGPKLSHIWSILFIAVILVNTVISLFYLLPAQSEIQRELDTAMGTPATPGTDQLESTMQIFGSIFGVIMYSIYPVLALIFLKNRKVGDFLQQHGK